MEARRRGVRDAKAMFRVWQNVGISNEEMKFAKNAEQNFSTDIFRIATVIERHPPPLYELEDLNGTPIEGQFYQEELIRVRVTRRTVYKIDKILNKRVRRGLLEHLVRRRVYSKDFDSWIPAPSMRGVPRRSETLLVTLLSNTSNNLYPVITIAAFTAELARPVELGSSYNWEVGVCEFSYPPNSVGTFKHTTVDGDSTGLIYCDLISPQYLGRALVRCMRTFISPSLSGQHRREADV